MQTRAIAGLPNPAAEAYHTLLDCSAAGKHAVFCSASEERLGQYIDAASALSALDKFKPAPLTALLAGSPHAVSMALGRLRQARMQKRPALAALAAGEEAPRLFSPEEYECLLLELKIGLRARRSTLADSLEKAGYERKDFLEQPGEYAIRGAVLDIFAVDQEHPCRLFMAGDYLESMRFFNPDTQESTGPCMGLTVLPACFPKQGEESPLDEWFETKPEKLYDSFPQAPAPPPWLGAVSAILAPLDLSTEGSADAGLLPNPMFGADMRMLGTELERLGKDGLEIFICCASTGEAARLGELMSDSGINAKPSFFTGEMERGFQDPKRRFAVVTASEIFSRGYSSSKLLRRFSSEGSSRVRFGDLKPGDFVVHEEHGVGRYVGLKEFPRASDDLSGDTPGAECLLLEYTRGHRVFVPLEEFGKIQKFVGSEGKPPRLSALSGAGWNEAKRRIKEEAAKIAKELLEFQAMRAAIPAPPLGGDSHIEAEFAASFPFEETPDQARAIESVLSDLSGERAADRLLVGDVGFGKTEVAMRAALRCALSGCQAAILVPTTVLAAQHYRTFSQRLAGYPVSVSLMSRFQNKKEQKQTLQSLATGACDIVIGTHRLLSKDVRFRKLGLCIIDEEHRFGVKQKEKIKALRAGAHTLMLSATPIPRTLHQSLASLRDISVIETPPEGRMPIATRIMPWDERFAAAAIRTELGRGGQVYYVYNRVKSMQSRLGQLRELVPEARICHGHGQMDSAQLEKTMMDFFNKEQDVLLSSTIIESGLDMQNVNTLIVEDAHLFGLAQLYQLRGRIGRGKSRAFCYLFYPQWLKPKVAQDPAAVPDPDAPPDTQGLTEEASKRLSALKEFAHLGSGFRLAMRDMEIRGAGELLGLRQHGFINEVGLGLYCELLNREVERLKGSCALETERAPATIDLKAPAFIPPDYLPDEMERLNHYKRFLSSREPEKVLTSIEDVCGTAPEPVRNLAAVMSLRLLCADCGVRKVEQRLDALSVFFHGKPRLPQDALPRLMTRFGGKLEFIRSLEGDGIRIPADENAPLESARAVLQFLKDIVSKT